MKTIQLTQGFVALVDDEDFERVNQFNWSVLTKNKTSYYARRTHSINGKRTSLLMHRFVLKLDKEDTRDIDHIDHNGLNNQKSNLRICSSSENSRNLIKWNKEFKGVTFTKERKKWRAMIRFNKLIHLGYFKTPEQAAHAYDAAAIKYFGEFAHLNFPLFD